MKRQQYFPRTVEARPEWFGNLANELPTANVTIGLPALDVTAIINKALYLKYVTGLWRTAVRDFGPACTSAIDELYLGFGTQPFVLPVFAAPALPAGVTAVAAGALRDIFDFIQAIKARPSYTEAIGLQLGIVGSEDTAENLLPDLLVKVERGGNSSCECAKVIFKKYGRQGVVVYSKRGTGDWEKLGIDLNSPYLDERPLLNPTAPEMRQYRLQYYDDDAPVGDYTEIFSVTISP